MDTGADAYLIKPFEKEELFIRLRKLIELRQTLKEKYQHIDLATLPHATIAQDLDLQFLQQFERIVLGNLNNENFKVYPDVCQAISMSRPQLYRKLKALKDISPGEYIRNLRLQKARELLYSTHLSIGEIAMHVGFRNHSYFTKMYVAKYGKMPKEERGK